MSEIKRIEIINEIARAKKSIAEAEERLVLVMEQDYHKRILSANERSGIEDLLSAIEEFQVFRFLD